MQISVKFAKSLEMNFFLPKILLFFTKIKFNYTYKLRKSMKKRDKCCTSFWISTFSDSTANKNVNPSRKIEILMRYCHQNLRIKIKFFYLFWFILVQYPSWNSENIELYLPKLIKYIKTEPVITIIMPRIHAAHGWSLYSRSFKFLLFSRKSFLWVTSKEY